MWARAVSSPLFLGDNCFKSILNFFFFFLKLKLIYLVIVKLSLEKKKKQLYSVDSAVTQRGYLPVLCWVDGLPWSPAVCGRQTTRISVTFPWRFVLSTLANPVVLWCFTIRNRRCLLYLYLLNPWFCELMGRYLATIITTVRHPPKANTNSCFSHLMMFYFSKCAYSWWF